MAIVTPIMRIVLQIKSIARCPKNRYHSLHYNIKGNKVKKLLKSFKTTLHRSLPNNIQTKVVYTETKVGSHFQIKSKTKFDHKHDIVYYVKCPECQEDYIGKIGRRLHERICGHNQRDSQFHMLRHSLENNHKHISFEDFRILQNGYTNSKLNKKYRYRCLLKNYVIRKILNKYLFIL